MPIYLYTHGDTNENQWACKRPWEFEIEQKITEDKLRKCPDCGGNVERLIAPGSSFKFKGGAPTAKRYT